MSYKDGDEVHVESCPGCKKNNTTFKYSKKYNIMAVYCYNCKRIYIKGGRLIK